MFIDSFYNLEFKFDKNSEGLDHLFPSMELLIRSLENIDRFLVSAVGYKLEYRRYLKNIGEESFTFSIRARLFRPHQIALGEDFPSSNVLEWMCFGRQAYIDAANSNGEGSPDISEALKPLVDRYSLKNSILYSEISNDDIESLSRDLNNAVSFLGGTVRIEQSVSG